MTYPTLPTALGILLLASNTIVPAATPDSTAADHHRRGVEFHLQRRLDEASRDYARALAADPAREPSLAERETIFRFAPRLAVTPWEPFALKDAAAVLHPEQRLVAYHLFWEDDIDFPDDNDPCDHEVVWIRFDENRSRVEAIWTYFHDHLVEGGPEALEDARRNGGRALVCVQWGKHGSMPFDWQRATSKGTHPPISLLEDNRRTWTRLSTDGRRSKDNPLAKRLGWPDTFPGAFERFVDFTRPVDPVPLLQRERMLAVSRWNSAVIDQWFLAYNFRPKTEWPPGAVR
ncbi:MAG: hypothetical protein JNL97_07665 [Verrucomicrobiales bacterium]|nr:hypothetical protein [Verrucomicrobiales bacterium]